MAGSGKQAFIGIAPEVTWSTEIAATDYLKFSSETLNLAIEELVANSLRNLRDEPDSYEGLGSIAGNTVHEVHPNGLGYMLRSWFGKCLTTTPTGTVRKHIFTPGLNVEGKGTADSGTTTTLIDSGLVATDDMYNGCWLHIISGTNAGAWRYISDCDASDNELTVSVAFASAIDNTSVFEIRNGPEDCVVPPYTLEIGRDLAKSFQYEGSVVNTLAFSFGVNAKILNLTAGWITKDVNVIDNTTPAPEETEPFRWNQAYLFIGRDYSTAVDINGETNTTVKLWDVGATYTINALIGKWVRMTSGNCQDQIRKITANTATSITWSPAMSQATADADTYEVWSENQLLEGLSITLDNGLMGLPLLNNSKRIAKMVGDRYRTGTLTANMLVESRTDWETYFKGWSTLPWFIMFRGATSTSPYNYEFQLHLPKVLFTAYPLGVAGPGRLRVAAVANIKYDSTSEFLAQAILFNTLSSYT